VGGDGTVQPVSGPIQSNALQDMLTANATVITDFSITKVSQYQYELRGTVSGTNVAGLTVTFGGQPLSVQGKTATVNADGTFYLLVEMDNGARDQGQVTAQILKDAAGQPSNVADDYVFNVGN